MYEDDLSDIQNRARAQNLVRVIERFVDRFNDRAGESHAADVILDGETLRGDVIEQRPERFIEEELIDPIGDVLGHDFRFQPKGFDGLGGRIPDFEALNLEITNLGEVKTPGDIRPARKESVEYLDRAEDRPLAGIATDGFVWILHTAAERDSSPTYTHHATINRLIKDVRKFRTSSAEGPRRPHLREHADKFVREFNPDAIRSAIQ